MIKKSDGRAHARGAKKVNVRVGSNSKYKGITGLVDKVYGDGPYVVEYSVSDSGGYGREIAAPRNLKWNYDWISLSRARRFKTLKGATSFLVKKHNERSGPYLYLWKNRNAQPVKEGFDSSWGKRYPGNLLKFGTDDVRKCFGTITDSRGYYDPSDLEECIAKKLKIK